MIKSTIKQALTAVTLAAGAISSASAAFVLQSGDFLMTVNLYDSATTFYSANCNTVAGCDAVSTPAPGSMGSVNTSADTMGIFSIATITRLSDDSTYFTRGVDGYLTGIFGNLTDYNVSVQGTLTSALAVGGNFSLFQTATNYNSSLGPLVGPGKDLNNALYPGISNGILVLEGVFTSGVIAGDTTTTFSTTYNNSSINGGSGGYLDVTGGLWKDDFNTNSEIDMNGVARDLFATFTFRPNATATSNGWTVISTADITGSVPEPGALALIALGLLGAGAATRRKA